MTKAEINKKLREIFSLSLKIEGAIFSYNPLSNCVMVYDFVKSSIPEYSYNFEAYFGHNHDLLDLCIKDIRNHISQLKTKNNDN